MIFAVFAAVKVVSFPSPSASTRATSVCAAIVERLRRSHIRLYPNQRDPVRRFKYVSWCTNADRWSTNTSLYSIAKSGLETHLDSGSGNSQRLSDQPGWLAPRWPVQTERRLLPLGIRIECNSLVIDANMRLIQYQANQLNITRSEHVYH